MKAPQLIRYLENTIRQYGDDESTKKLKLLHDLKNTRLQSGKQVHKLHESLRFLRAYPDNADILDLVNSMLSNFSTRNDLKKYRDELVSTGIAGTAIDYNLFSPMARWLDDKWPEYFSIDWDYSDNAGRLMELMPLFLTFPEMAQFDDYDLTPKEWINRLKGPAETDATFLKRRLDRINKNNIYANESLHDRLDLAFRLEPGSNTPSTTGLYYPLGPVHYQSKPLQKKRPQLKKTIKELDFTVRYVSKKEGEKLVDLAKATMLTHERDLDAFSYGDKNDVRLIYAGDGLQMACIGTIPQHRYLLPVIYGYLNLKNGVPIGYFQVSVSYDVADIAFTTFSTFRGAEAAIIFSRNLAVAHQMFSINSFTLDPYQLGHGNKDGLQSGVWWFYYKLGFRPQDPYIKDVLREELKKMQRKTGYRSSLSTLDELSSENVYLDLVPGKSNRDLLPRLWKLSPGISTYLAQHYGFQREEGLRDCVKRANKLLGVHSDRKFSKNELHMWESWAPLVLQIPGINRWSRKDKRDLVAIIRAKGGRRESEFLKLFHRHKRLQRAILNFTDGVHI